MRALGIYLQERLLKVVIYLLKGNDTPGLPRYLVRSERGRKSTTSRTRYLEYAAVSDVKAVSLQAGEQVMSCR